eukprot:TRINITY_DN76661_c0_g1_i1.p1 TRINITY_DN76661_c0_g1~~TRINITY_DN76661_c0_g1_i1.p1  ORF type:complete len:191 (-),score=10.55 TRINITY_DN76661_c0_g1_i1:76-648(-)
MARRTLVNPLFLPIAVLLASLCIALAAAPTKDQIKAEVKKMADQINKKYPNYSRFANLIKQATSLSYDMSDLKDATILCPDNAAMGRLNEKVPVSAGNLNKMVNITRYLVIIRKYTVAKLRQFRAGQIFATMQKKPLWKQTAANATLISFGVKGTGAKMWATIKTPNLYWGPYFLAHGVNNYLVPPQTKI